jgi:cytochrome c-type biogenesis protein CcmH/NrfF
VRRLALIVALVVALAAPAAAQAPEPQTSLPDIEDEVMCPICGVTLELATESPQAIQEREFIRGLIAQGLTKDEIKDRLVAEFGPEVLAEPGDSGFDLAAWLVPGAAILIAAVAIFVGLRRWRRSPARPDDSPEPDAEERERLEADLARYEL